MTTHFCQCEHVKHKSAEEFDIPNSLAPLPRGAEHVYGMEVFDRADMIEQDTIYGKYLICKLCHEDHPIPEEYRA